VPVLATGKLFELPEGPLDVITLPGDRAFQAWSLLRAASAHTHHWPLLIDELDDFSYLTDERSLQPVADILSRSATLTLDEWLAREVAGDPEHYLPPAPGPWPDEVPHSREFNVIEGMMGHGRARIPLVLVPTSDPSAVPAVLRYGAWNACPPPEVHVAAFRHWGFQFKAEPVSIAGDTIEFVVNAPPTERSVAEALAHTHYKYCTDIVDQGCQTLEVLAATLLNDHRWFFWWD
jgi:hypothetical protein